MTTNNQPRKPFFARYLEAQENPNGATTKYPSDNDEWFGQQAPVITREQDGGETL